MAENYFSDLNAVNVNGHTEEKGKLTYLSWVWAWAEIKKRYPGAAYTVYENRDGWNYHTDGRTCWVKTGVTINGIEHVEYLPVMDNRNQSIPLERVTSFDVNRSIQRSITKACARHGLGLYIYAGEDLPDDPDAPEKPKKAPRTAQTPKQDKVVEQKAETPTETTQTVRAAKGQVDYIKSVCTDAEQQMLLDKYHITSLEELPMANATNLIINLQKVKGATA